MTARGNVTSVTPSSTKTRAIATVTKAGVTLFDELVLAMQTDAYMYEEAPIGVKPPAKPPVLVYTNAPALIYRSEPLTYRYAAASSVLAPAAAPAGTAAQLSNALVTPDLTTGIIFTPTMADPQTPILTTKAGTPVRVRWMCPARAGSDSAGSSQVLAVHGHVFQEEPYINDSKELGFNPLSQWMGGRFVLPGQTVDMLFASGGRLVRGPGRLLLRDVHRSDDGHGPVISAPGVTPKVTLPGPSQHAVGMAASPMNVCDRRTILVARAIEAPTSAFPALRTGGLGTSGCPLSTACEEGVRHERRQALAKGGSGGWSRRNQEPHTRFRGSARPCGRERSTLSAKAAGYDLFTPLTPPSQGEKALSSRCSKNWSGSTHETHHTQSCLHRSRWSAAVCRTYRDPRQGDVRRSVNPSLSPDLPKAIATSTHSTQARSLSRSKHQSGGNCRRVLDSARRPNQGPGQGAGRGR